MRHDDQPEPGALDTVGLGGLLEGLMSTTKPLLLLDEKVVVTNVVETE